MTFHLNYLSAMQDEWLEEESDSADQEPIEPASYEDFASMLGEGISSNKRNEQSNVKNVQKKTKKAKDMTSFNLDSKALKKPVVAKENLVQTLGLQKPPPRRAEKSEIIAELKSSAKPQEQLDDSDVPSLTVIKSDATSDANLPDTKKDKVPSIRRPLESKPSKQAILQKPYPKVDGSAKKTVSTAAVQAAYDKKKMERREQNLKNALSLKESKERVDANVWQVNAAGALVNANGVTGFVPFKELSLEHKAIVTEAQSGIAGNNSDDPQVQKMVNKKGMEILLGSLLRVRVTRVDEVHGRVIFSEQEEQRTPVPLTDSITMLLLESVGSIVDAHIRNIKDFGVFVEFPLPQTLHGKHPICLGLVHASEISWDMDVPDLRPGMDRKAKIIHVDTMKRRVFLSFKRTTMNPLLETLDSLLGSGGRSGSPPGSSSSRETFDSSSDMRPILGDMPEAVTLAGYIMQLNDVGGVKQGPRLQSRASSQNVELYLSKQQPTSDPSTGASVYTMIVRKGFDVQELQISGTISRNALVDFVADASSLLME